MALYQRSCLCGCVSVQGERLRGRVGAWDVAGPTVCLRRAPCQACPPIAACICSARVERIVASTQRVKRPARLRTPGSGGCFGHVVNHKEKRQPGGRAGRGFHGTEIRLHGDRAARYPAVIKRNRGTFLYRSSYVFGRFPQLSGFNHPLSVAVSDNFHVGAVN